MEDLFPQLKGGHQNRSLGSLRSSRAITMEAERALQRELVND